MTRSSFGSIRELPSGRHRATYRWEGQEYAAPDTFRTEAQANDWLTTEHATLIRGDWIDPRAGTVLLREYAETWLAGRRTKGKPLAVRTMELYRYLLDDKILPTFGDRSLAKITAAQVRAWHADLMAKHPSTAAKAYRLLSSIMRTAVTDDLLVRSPCRVKGGGTEPPSNAQIATLAQMQAAVDAMPEKLRALVLLAGWCQLRRAEFLGLRRRHFDLLHRTITVEVTRVLPDKGPALTKDPKSEAGKRSLSIPPHLVPVLQHHLDEYVKLEPDAWVFVGKKGRQLGPSYLYSTWHKARKAAGVPTLRLHDLRHTGLTLAAIAGATVAELMHRAGHSSAAAALRYQHATKERDIALAEALSALPDQAKIIPMSHGSRTPKRSRKKKSF